MTIEEIKKQVPLLWVEKMSIMPSILTARVI